MRRRSQEAEEAAMAGCFDVIDGDAWSQPHGQDINDMAGCVTELLTRKKKRAFREGNRELLRRMLKFHARLEPVKRRTGRTRSNKTISQMCGQGRRRSQASKTRRIGWMQVQTDPTIGTPIGPR